MPEKRFLFTPNLTQIVGSDFIRRRVAALQPDLHVFGLLGLDLKPPGMIICILSIQMYTASLVI